MKRLVQTGRAAGASVDVLTAGDLAYARARLQGVDPKLALERYEPETHLGALERAGQYSSTDAALLAAVRKADRRVNEALLFAAQRLGLVGAQRALRLIPRLRGGEFDVPLAPAAPQPPSPAVAARPALPSLEDLAEQYPDFSEEELIEHLGELQRAQEPDLASAPAGAGSAQATAQTDVDASQGRAEGKNARRLRIALRALERLRDHVGARAAETRSDDRLAAWLPTNVCRRLALANLHTIDDLATAAAQSRRWYAPIAGLGAGKASDIETWLLKVRPSLGSALTSRPETAPQPPCPPATADSARSLSSAFALRPLELFDCPPRRTPSPADIFELNAFPGQRRQRIRARNDREAIEAWLNTLPSPHSRRAYRKEAERFVLWAYLQRKIELAEATVEDCTAYLNFAKAPPAQWRAMDARQRVAPRGSPEWRPFGERALSAAALRHLATILGSLYEWLAQADYLTGNPWRLEQTPRDPHARQRVAQRALSASLRDVVLNWALALQPADAASEREQARCERQRLVLQLLLGTGLRRDELSRAKFADIEYFEDDSARGYMLRVVGKGQRERRVPLVEPVLRAIEREASLRLRRLGLSAEGRQAWSTSALSALPLVSNLRDPAATHTDDSTIYEVTKGALTLIAHTLERDGQPERAALLRRASPHWARHTFGTLGYRNGADIRTIQELLGHASINTTTLYAHVSAGQLIDAASRAMTSPAENRATR